MYLDFIQQERVAVEKLVRWIIAVTVTLRSRPHGDAVTGRHNINSTAVPIIAAQCKSGHHYSRLTCVLLPAKNASSEVKHLKQRPHQVRVIRLVQGIARDRKYDGINNGRPSRKR